MSPFLVNGLVMYLMYLQIKKACLMRGVNVIKREYLVKNTTDIRIDVIFYD